MLVNQFEEIRNNFHIIRALFFKKKYTLLLVKLKSQKFFIENYLTNYLLKNKVMQKKKSTAKHSVFF